MYLNNMPLHMWLCIEETTEMLKEQKQQDIQGI